MKFLREKLDEIKPNFSKGGKFEKFHPAFEAIDTILYVPKEVTSAKGVQVKDAVDLKRLMMTVVIALIPCLLFGMWNVGFQHYLAIGETSTFIDQFLYGAMKVLPIVIVAYAVGGLVEGTFSVLRNHPIAEGFLVTGMLVPLCIPASIPLWQVALAMVFAIVLGIEVFGGVGTNVLNVALTARAFLYFAYPTDISGDVWTAGIHGEGIKLVEGYTGATPLAIAHSTPAGESVANALSAVSYGGFDHIFSLKNLFMGVIPGSIGETSTLAILIGAAILIVTGVASWRIIVGVFGGAWLTGLLLNAFAVNPFMGLPAHYHLVMGGLAFGAVFMATDPVTAAHTTKGKWIYGILIGAMTVIIRVFNPAYPEGIMLAILLMNVFAPLIDHYVVEANKTKRLKRATV
ncbi:NADH:ubiquinone reductase (Na(+)-transporting) subunit B [Persicobacter psychrovividus]|uniref:Na(+)-translocating NADH-quinone reductase subunit B n=1 Tax=Persicobacter psychrovividus TaxID=387638 RepID=A0ABM7VBC3_9BACT|nr:Na(+)-translocating NADH-quinone reductase subunit B [Persicobacter psychrovividus]